MRCLKEMAIVVLVGPGAALVFAQDSESARILLELEKKVSAARTMKVVSSYKSPGDDNSMLSGTRTKIIGEGDKVRVESIGKFQKAEATLKLWDIVISDGKSIDMRGGYSSEPRKVAIKNEPIKPRFMDDLRRLTTFIGEGQCLLERAGREKEKDSPISVTDIRPIKNEQINGREALGLTYKAKFQEIGRTVPTSYRVELWLDAKSRLPVKRTLTMLPDEKTKNPSFRLEESYSEFVLDVPVDAKLFEIPAK